MLRIPSLEPGVGATAPTVPDEWPPWLTRDLTAAYLRFVHGMQFGVTALAKAATKGTGPPFSKQGAKLVSYWRADVDEWARTRMSRKVRCTHELRDTVVTRESHVDQVDAGGYATDSHE